MMWREVDLAAPFRPRRANISPCLLAGTVHRPHGRLGKIQLALGTEKLRSSMATTSVFLPMPNLRDEYTLRRFSTSTAMPS